MRFLLRRSGRQACPAESRICPRKRLCGTEGAVRERRGGPWV